jgi:hypothetical protein
MIMPGSALNKVSHRSGQIAAANPMISVRAKASAPPVKAIRSARCCCPAPILVPTNETRGAPIPRTTDYTAVSSNPTPREQPRSAVERAEERLAALRLQIAREKRRLRDASVREKGIREGVVGRAVWDLVEEGKLEQAVIDLIRDELRGRLNPAQAAALLDTIFEQEPNWRSCLTSFTEATAAVRTGACMSDGVLR